MADMFISMGKEARILEGAHATVSALRHAVREADVIHIACHTGVRTSSSTPILLLAPDIVGRDSGELSEDRILTEFLLHSGCFVNLAGCVTAAQAELSTPIMNGLVPAFLIAGAGSVLASVWPIRDERAAQFQMEFYQQLLQGGRPAECLAATQRRCITGELGPTMREGENWAAYVLYGAG